MVKSNSVGFREVLVDQPFMGKWMDVDMNLGGGHTTFQGTKFSDFAGGFSYRSGNGGKAGGVVQNRCIYWRTLNDTLELTELSMDYNLVDNQVRYIFQDSPIVGPVAIQETENNVVILVATVTSVNRFVFTHPKRIEEVQAPGDKVASGNTRPSIFFQVCNKPPMNFKSFNLYENAINISVPLCAACHYVDRGQLGECVFAFSFENGKVHVYKVSRDDVLTSHDLKQSNIFAKISGFASHFLKGPTSSTDAVIGMNFFTTRGGKTKAIELVTLGMNGTLNLWHCPSLDVFTEWVVKPYGLVDPRFAVNGATDSSMLLRKTQEPKQLPKFYVYVPCVGIKFFQVIKNTEGQFNSSATVNNSSSPYTLVESDVIDFQEQELIDFSISSDLLFVLVSNPEEETDWEVKYCQIRGDGAGKNYKTFTQAVLEDIPPPDVEVYPSSLDAKEFYMDLIFNKCSFNAATIIKALSMFKKEEDEDIKDKDWESLKVTAMNIIDREIQIATSHTDFGVADDELAELSLKNWLQFYNSCVEYHIHTIKPLGLFFELNTKMLCVVKKSRISFLRPTSFLETLYYFPQFFACADASEHTDDEDFQNLMLTKYMDLIKVIENLLLDPYLRKIEKQLSMDHGRVFDMCRDIITMVVDNDPSCAFGERRKVVPELLKRIRELGSLGNNVMKLIIMNLHSWETDSSALGEVGGMEEGDDEEEERTSNVVSDKFMGSRVGSHLAYKCLMQLLEHRYTIARDTLLLQELISLLGAQIDGDDEKNLEFDEDDKFAALFATLNYYAWRQLADEGLVSVKPFVKDRGLKVANILKIFTGDHLKPSENAYFDTFWPSKTIEAFLMSQVGGIAARGRVSRESSKSCILAFAEATGRVLWEVNDGMSRDRPFEDFLISSGQYLTLLRYATYMHDYFPWAKAPSKKFYTALAYLFLDQVEVALGYFRCIISNDIETDLYFNLKILEASPPTCEQSGSPSETSRLEFYIKVIRIFQVFECSSCVKRLAEDALELAVQEGNDGAVTQMCSLAFKTSLHLGDYDAAFASILRMPSYEEEDGGGRRERKEKLASLRMLVSTLVQRREVQVLLALNWSVPFNETEVVREQVENILFAQANLSDPLCLDGAYQMLYLYHLERQNFHIAADIMYHRAMRIGDRGAGLDGLEAQKESYLDVVTCLNLVEPKTFQYVVQHTGITPMHEQAQKSHPFKLDGVEVRVAPFTKEAVVVVRTLKEVQMELELITLLVKISDKVIPNPVKMFNFRSDAEKAVECLSGNHFYDDAIKLARLWGIEVSPIVSVFADVCSNLVYNVVPDNEDPYEYVRYNDVTELPGNEGGVVDMAFRLLRRYMETLEAPVESTIHKAVTLKLLAADIDLPQWLISSYKKRNTSELLRCYISYAFWEEATKLTLQILDGTLGRRDCSEFDVTVRKISAYDSAEPAIPFNDINVLICELEDRSAKEPQLGKMVEGINEKVRLFCDRVLECRRERSTMSLL